MKKHQEPLIRRATKADMPKLLELYKELHPLDPPIDDNMAADVWEQSINSGAIYFVADNNERIVATCYVAIIPNITRLCSPIGFLENIITSTSCRRRGIGRKLLEAAVDYAKERGCYKVMIQSGIKRTDAHKLYETAGFDSSSKRAFEIRFNQGNALYP